MKKFMLMSCFSVEGHGLTVWDTPRLRSAMPAMPPKPQAMLLIPRAPLCSLELGELTVGIRWVWVV